MVGETIVDDQHRHTLKALERRFEAAQAELDIHKKKTVKRSKTEEAGKKSHISSSLAVDSSPNLANTSASSSTPSKKDIDESGPTYAKLAQSVDENLLKASVEVSGGRQESKVDKVLHKLLQSGDSAQKYMQGSRSKRIDNWILLDNYVQGRGVSTSSRARALQIHSKRSKKNMSMKQQKKKGLFDFPKDFHSFDEFKSMHEMWKGYIMQLLKSTGKNQLAQFLLSADLHGAIISVAECKVTSDTGVSGIMIRETAETFGIITQDDKFLETGCFRVKTVVAMFREHYFQSNYEYEQAQLFEVAMNQIQGPNDIPLFHQDMVDPLGGWLV